MPPIKGMQVDLFTHEDDEPGTDDEDYIGFSGTGGGRDFPLSVTDFEDFDTGSEVRYILGGEPGPNPAPGPFEAGTGQRSRTHRYRPRQRQYIYIREKAYGKKQDDDAYKVKFVQVFVYGLPGAVRSPGCWISTFACETRWHGSQD